MNTDLTLEEKACNYDTMRHIERVRNLLNVVVVEFLRRGEQHDQSKLDSPEVQAFTELTPKLAACSFGSEEYEGFKKQLSTALAHHYAKNSHHIEHYKNGIEDMDLFDVFEMFVDWKASSERQHDGNILKSIEHQGRRYNIAPQFVRILENTAKTLSKGIS